MIDETRALFSLAEALWSPDGWNMAIPLTPVITERVFATASADLHTHLTNALGPSARVTFDPEPPVGGHGHHAILRISADDFLGADPIALRDGIDATLRSAAEAVERQTEIANTQGLAWMTKFVGAAGDSPPS